MKKIIIIFLFCLFARNVWATTKITIQDSPPQIYPNQEFSVVFNIINDFISSDSYYVKGRIGSTSASLNKAETYNPTTNSWLSDTSSWNSFPIINFSNDTIATASIKLRTNQTVSIENNLLVIRINKNGNYDSSPSALFVFEPTTTPTPTLIPTPTVIINLSPTPTLIPTEALMTPTPTPVINKIYLSEIMANPNTGENEWVELYNDNDYFVTLDNWMIDDQTGGGATPFYFSLTIPAFSYNSVNLSKTMFNNDEDQVNLYNSNNILQDSFEYQKSKKNITLGRINWENDDFCEQTPSKNLSNRGCLNDTITPTSTTHTPTPTTTIKTVKNSTNIITSPKPQTFYPIPNKNISNIYSPITNKIKYDPDVLGLTSDYSTRIKYPLIINYLNFISLSYSFLTIGGILAKIKRWS